MKELINRPRLIITCEHGGNLVPPEYQPLFKGEKPVLNSHRGHDAGALVLAKQLAQQLKVPLFFSEITRLLVDLNRSTHHPRLFSEFIRDGDRPRKQQILSKYYFPYRHKVENEIRNALREKQPVIHFSIHSFTPELDGDVRTTDIGLLYDPKRKRERVLCTQLKSILHDRHSGYLVRSNYPYRGTADGFTTALRKQFSDNQYAGIEIEINQKHVQNKKHWPEFRKHIIAGISELMKN